MEFEYEDLREINEELHSLFLDKYDPELKAGVQALIVRAYEAGLGPMMVETLRGN